MKKNIFISVLVLVFVLFSFSCSSLRTVEKEPDPYYLGDFNPFYIGDVVCLTKTTFGNTKPLEMNLYFAPRTSDIEFRFNSGMNKILLSWTPEECEALISSIQTYSELINGETKLENRKPTKKNAFYNGNVGIYWGVGGYTRDNIATYFTNYEYLEENRPYFKVKVNATPYPEEEYVSSPNIEMFFSPSQLETLITVIDYEAIYAKVEELKTEAYSW